MASFVKVGERFVNLDYVSRVDVDAEFVKMFVDDMPPMTVPADDVPGVLKALAPPRYLLESAVANVRGGLGGEGLPPGMFRPHADFAPQITREPLVATPPVPVVPGEGAGTAEPLVATGADAGAPPAPRANSETATPTSPEPPVATGADAGAPTAPRAKKAQTS